MLRLDDLAFANEPHQEGVAVKYRFGQKVSMQGRLIERADVSAISLFNAAVYLDFRHCRLQDDAIDALSSLPAGSLIDLTDAKFNEASLVALLQTESQVWFYFGPDEVPELFRGQNNIYQQDIE